MPNGHELPPEQFIKEVLNMYYGTEKYTVKAISIYFNVGVVTIRRIITQYEYLKDKPILLIEDTRHKEAKKKINELNDKKRDEKEKLTKDDFLDLEIDLKLFEKGKEPDEEKEN